jgi:type IV secretory pathway VirB4 component
MDDFISVLSGRTETVKLLEGIMKEKGQSPDDWLDTFLQRRKKL